MINYLKTIDDITFKIGEKEDYRKANNVYS
jgi:hypothetical protein